MTRSDTSARDSRRAFAFGSLARNGLIGERAGMGTAGWRADEAGSGGAAGGDAPTAGRENAGEIANGRGAPGTIAGRVTGGAIGAIGAMPLRPGALGWPGDAVAPKGGTIGRAA